LPESAGKSSFCYSLAAEFQKAYPDKYIAYIDVEHALSLPYMADFGVNVDSDHLVFTQPSTAEEALEIYNELALSAACSLIILDSIGSMSTKAQLERGMDEKTMGAVAAVLGVAVNQIKDSCSKTQTTGVFINQVREKLSKPLQLIYNFEKELIAKLLPSTVMSIENPI
jgi:recombination protein RecA